MSQERVFVENLLSQRFSFFLVVFSLVLAGAINSKSQLHLQIILTLGAIVTALFAGVLGRSQEKLDLILADLFATSRIQQQLLTIGPRQAEAEDGGSGW